MWNITPERSNLSESPISSARMSPKSSQRMKISFLLNEEAEPVGSSSDSNGNTEGGLVRQNSKRYWTKEEDDLLRSLATKYGASNWTSLAKHFDNRTACQLRCRWAYAVSNSRSQRAFTPEEDRFLLEQYSVIGNRWSHIASLMEDRLGNDIKNRIRLLERRQKRAELRAIRTLSGCSS
mmetsp:Transcript_7270/g.15566  ORF Transcript_7270/g.15566 Transcript_7270/m.15566 type:complete len:179 (+) Transcript_7270:262-798(+)